jgi:hypothetical protein
MGALVVSSSDPAQVSGAEAPRRSHLPTAGLVVLGALIGVLGVEPLFEHSPPSIFNLDLSWQLSLGAALAQHLQFGPQYIFTYGPLGFLHVSMAYPTALLTDTAAVVTVLFHVAYAVAMLLFANLVRRGLNLGRTAGVAILLATGLVAYWTGFAADLGSIAEFLSLLAFAACLLRPAARVVPALAVGAGILLAFGALFTADQLAVGLGELAILTVVSWWTPGRPIRVPLLAWLAFVSAYLILWLAAGQHLSNLPSFWLGSWELAAGYSAAMALGTQWQSVAEIAALAILGIAIPVLLHRWQGWQVSAQEAVIALTLPWLYVSWKDGLVRIDGFDNLRALALLSALLAVAWLVALVSSRTRPYLALGPIAASALCVIVIIVVFGPLISTPWILTQLPPPRAAGAVRQTPPAYIPQRLVSELRGHTVNVLPWDISLVVDNHLRWDPLPEPQTYAAYTQYLDHLDATQLASTSGASRLVVSLLDIDDRYVLWDPPAVWETVLSRYDCLATTGISAILARRPAVIGSDQPLARASTTFGRWLSVPATPLPYEFARVHIANSLEGVVFGLALRQTAVFVNLRLSNGHKVGPIRLVVNTARDGLYLSHFTTTARQLCGVLSGTANRVPRIVAIQFTTDHPTQWARSISVSFVGANAIAKAAS